jgi:hypothetical protein
VAAAPPADPQVAAVQQEEARELLEAQTQPPPDSARTLELLQGGYYLALGLWPVVSADSFQLVTGPRTDLWLLRTIGLVIAVIGIALLSAVRRRSVALEMMIVAGGVAAVLGITDIINVSVKAVSPIYALDSMAQAIFVFGWLRALMSLTSAVHLVTK